MESTNDATNQPTMQQLHETHMPEAALRSGGSSNVTKGRQTDRDAKGPDQHTPAQKQRSQQTRVGSTLRHKPRTTKMFTSNAILWSSDAPTGRRAGPPSFGATARFFAPSFPLAPSTPPSGAGLLMPNASVISGCFMLTLPLTPPVVEVLSRLGPTSMDVDFFLFATPCAAVPLPMMASLAASSAQVLRHSTNW